MKIEHEILDDGFEYLHAHVLSTDAGPTIEDVVETIRERARELELFEIYQIREYLGMDRLQVAILCVTSVAWRTAVTQVREQFGMGPSDR